MTVQLAAINSTELLSASKRPFAFITSPSYAPFNISRNSSSNRGAVEPVAQEVKADRSEVPRKGLGRSIIPKVPPEI